MVKPYYQGCIAVSRKGYCESNLFTIIPLFYTMAYFGGSPFLSADLYPKAF